MNQSSAGFRRTAAALAALVVFVLFVNLGGAPLFDEDEGAYAEVTREMIATGDYLTPRLNGDLFFHKPPLMYWCQAASVHLFGLNEFAFRFPSAVATALWALGLAVFARRFFDTGTAAMSVVFMITGIQTGVIGKAAIADALLNLFIALTFFHMYAFSRSRSRRDLLNTYVFMALGVMTKGPVAVALPFMGSMIFFGLQRQWRDWLRAIFSPAGWAVLLAITLPWFIAMYRIHGRLFFDEIFLTQNVNRFQTAFEGHSGSFFYYIPVILLGMMPHTGVVLKVVQCSRDLWRQAVNRYLIIWFVVVFVFFSLAGTKLHHYIVYGYTPVFILMGQVAGRLRHRWTYWVWPMALLIVLLVLPDAADRIRPMIGDPFARTIIPQVLPLFSVSYRLAVIAAIIGLVLAWTLFRKPAAARMTATGVVLALLVHLVVVPIAGRIMQQPIKEAALMAKRKNWDVVMWEMTYPSFAVYREQPLNRRPLAPGDIVITKETKTSRIGAHEVLYRRYGIVMARVKGL